MTLTTASSVETVLKAETRSLGQCLALQVRARGSQLAVVHEGGSLTMAELWAGAAGLAGRLHELGIATDQVVGVYTEPSADLMVGVWGTLLAGAAYLPLAPEYPADRVRYMLEDSAATIVVTQSHLRAQLLACTPSSVRVITADDVVAVPDDLGLNPAASDLAYAIYTSGSTGRPKGVGIEHRSIVSQLRWMGEELGLGPGDRVLQKTPFSFDAAQWEILAPALGATAVMAPLEAYRDVDQLVDTVVEHEVTILQGVPTLWKALVDAGRLGECSSLRHVFSGGELLTTGLATALLRDLQGAALTNLYGPTETTINATSQLVTPELLTVCGPVVPIGAPVQGTDLVVLDDDQRAVNQGSVGQLHIGGVQLARGYLGNRELTDEKFISWTGPDGRARRLYRTGDVARWDDDGRVVFVGRTDHQVKVNGHRIELDEVRVAIEDHHWVRQACVVPWENPRTGAAQLAAFLELDPREAALMDQGAHGAHHQSKRSRVQVRAQLAQQGLRSADELAGRVHVDLPAAQAAAAQFTAAFARKTYRFYEGGQPTLDELREWLGSACSSVSAPPGVQPASLDLPLLGEVLRWLGPFSSPDRLLPKYAYASPGALYATQTYLELTGVAGVAGALYYFHPVRHQLVRMADRHDTASPQVRLHLLGKPSAIESVYTTNVREVLAMEAGHLLGLLDTVLPPHGLRLRRCRPESELRPKELGVSSDLRYLHGVDVLAAQRAGAPDDRDAAADAVRVFLQSHRDAVVDLPAGLYEWVGDDLHPVGEDVVERKHVIAINQEVYDRASFGITMACPRHWGWDGFVQLGRTLQRLQGDGRAFGLMSAGYSSLTDHDLPSAKRFESLVDPDGPPSQHLTYFALGGRISAEQQVSTGMQEDVVHMRGPAEILKQDLERFLPSYMIPARLDILDALPKTPNGKCDVTALTRMARIEDAQRPLVAPSTPAEGRVVEVWAELLGIEDVSVTDDFFESGGNSLLAVSLVNRLNAVLGVELPLQTLFTAPTPQGLAAAAERSSPGSRSRLVTLQPRGEGRPVYCWPGLGGFPMNLRPLGAALGQDRPVLGVQAHGINAGEVPFDTIQEMASADVRLIMQHQQEGPVDLLGYSFGARVAFETAFQLEAAGRTVNQLVLVAPGSPRSSSGAQHGAATFDNPYYVQILLSVFTGSLHSELLDRCHTQVKDEQAFVQFVHDNIRGLTPALVRRIVAIVRQTFEFEYTFEELDRRVICAEVTVVKAVGDDYSFIEGRRGYSHKPPRLVRLPLDHYAILTQGPVNQLADSVRDILKSTERGAPMPHVNIKHYPITLSEPQRQGLVVELTAAVTKAFRCAPDVVSIALEPVSEGDWGDRVLEPEILARPSLLAKTPNYAS